METKYASMTRQEAIEAILQDYPDITRAMEESFREGFLRGEQFGKQYYSQGPQNNERTITIKKLQESMCDTWSVKDDSVRGCTTKYTEEVKQGDKVVIENYFTLVI